LLAALSACSRFERSRECNGYARLLNRAMADIAADHERGAAPATYQRIAERYDRAARDLEKIKSRHPELQQLLNEYRTLYRQTTVVLRQAAALVGKPEHAATLKRERTTLESLVRQEKSLAHRFESSCRSQ
jgi:hypothetical protein